MNAPDPAVSTAEIMVRKTDERTVSSAITEPTIDTCQDKWIVAIIGQQSRPAYDDAPAKSDKPEPAPLPEPQQRCLLPVKEAAYLLGIGKTKAYDLIAAGELPAVRIGSKMLVRRMELEDYMAKLPRSKPTRFVSKGRKRGTQKR